MGALPIAALHGSVYDNGSTVGTKVVAFGDKPDFSFGIDSLTLGFETGCSKGGLPVSGLSLPKAEDAVARLGVAGAPNPDPGDLLGGGLTTSFSSESAQSAASFSLLSLCCDMSTNFRGSWGTYLLRDTVGRFRPKLGT